MPQYKGLVLSVLLPRMLQFNLCNQGLHPPFSKVRGLCFYASISTEIDAIGNA